MAEQGQTTTSSSSLSAELATASAAERASTVLLFSSEILLFQGTHNTPSVTSFVLLKIDTHARKNYKFRLRLNDWVERENS
jgi:hypothetical protein